MVDSVVWREVSLVLRGRWKGRIFICVTDNRHVLFIKSKRIVSLIQSAFSGYFEALIVHEGSLTVAGDAHYFLAFNKIPRHVLSTLKLFFRNHLRVHFQVKFEHWAVRRGVNIFGCRRLRVSLRKNWHVELSQTLRRLNILALFRRALISLGSYSWEKLDFWVQLHRSILCGLRELA